MLSMDVHECSEELEQSHDLCHSVKHTTIWMGSAQNNEHTQFSVLPRLTNKTTTFLNRYWVNATYWERVGPVFHDRLFWRAKRGTVTRNIMPQLP
ncbi:hypothetical protein BYT27DRAFT_6893136 [Phlegmacium glaucopus]|nr:hypothetical protein BYT27DRAFT_6893136 [Phlegmacium glaucopus]